MKIKEITKIRVRDLKLLPEGYIKLIRNKIFWVYDLENEEPFIYDIV